MKCTDADTLTGDAGMSRGLPYMLASVFIGSALIVLLSASEVWVEEAEPAYEGLSWRQWSERIRDDPSAAQRLCSDLPRSRTVVTLLLAEEELKVQVPVLEALGTDEGVEAFWPHMLRLLGSSSRQVADCAADALETGARSLPPIALEALSVLLLREGQNTSRAVLRVLGAMGSRAVDTVPTILAFIKLRVGASGVSGCEQRLAAETLAGMGNAGVVRFIEHAARGSTEDASLLLQVLALAGRRVAEPLAVAALDGPATARDAAMDALSGLGIHGLAAVLGAAGGQSGVEFERTQQIIRATARHYLHLIGVDRQRAIVWPERLGGSPRVCRATVWSVERGWIDVCAFDWEGEAGRVSRLTWPGMASLSGFLWSRARLPTGYRDAASELLRALGGLVLADPPATGIWSAGRPIALEVSVLRPGQDPRLDLAYAGIRRHSLLETEAVRALACREVLVDLSSSVDWCIGDPDDCVLGALSRAVAGASGQPAWAQRVLLAAAEDVGNGTLRAAIRAYMSDPATMDAPALRCAIDAYARLSGVDLRPVGFSLEDVRRVRRRYLQLWGVAGTSGD